jgi:hypothetical protein
VRRTQKWASSSALRATPSESLPRAPPPRVATIATGTLRPAARRGRGMSEEDRTRTRVQTSSLVARQVAPRPRRARRAWRPRSPARDPRRWVPVASVANRLQSSRRSPHHPTASGLVSPWIALVLATFHDANRKGSIPVGSTRVSRSYGPIFVTWTGLGLVVQKPSSTATPCMARWRRPCLLRPRPSQKRLGSCVLWRQSKSIPHEVSIHTLRARRPFAA